MRLLGIVLLLIGPCVPIWGTVHFVTGYGVASVYNGDLGQADTEATADAQVNALESIGVQVSSQRFVERGMLLSNQVHIRTEGYIRTTEVIHRGVNDDTGLYEVELQAWIDTDLTPASLAERRRRTIVFLDLPETVQHDRQKPQPLPERIVEDRLKAALSEEGFHAYTWTDLHLMQATLAHLGAAMPAQPDAWGNLLMAGLLVQGEVPLRFKERTEVDADRFFLFYRVYPRITVLEPVIPPRTCASFTHPIGFKGAVIRPGEVPAEARITTADSAVAHLVPVLKEYARLHTTRFTLAVDGLSDFAQYKLTLRLLRSRRFVGEVEGPEGFVPGKVTRFQIEYRETPDLLRSQLHRQPGLKVTHFQNTLIRAEFTGF